MIVLERTGVVAGEPSRQIMALFGAGLIGCSILAGLAGIAKYAQKHFPFSWQNAGERQQHANEIERYIAELAGTEGVPCVVSVIWAAGRAGFLSTSPEILEELSAFRDVLAFADRLGSRLSSARHMFHLTSSAGGLFEGQRLVDQDSKPEPRRPYGELKLGQERLLAKSTSQIAKFVYRPSSVYGSAGEGLRLGTRGRIGGQRDPAWRLAHLWGSGYSERLRIRSGRWTLHCSAVEPTDRPIAGVPAYERQAEFHVRNHAPRRADPRTAALRAIRYAAVGH